MSCEAQRAQFEAADQKFVEANATAQDARAAEEQALEAYTNAQEASADANAALAVADRAANEAYDNWRQCVVGGASVTPVRR